MEVPHMELSPEERKKIYEEEKAKLEAREQYEREKGNIPPEMSVNLTPRVAGLLCYLGAWITGIIFLVLEQKNKWVRFHAAQSLVTFGILWIASMILGWIPYIGGFFSSVLGILGVILWIVLMVKAYNGERYKVPWAGDIAEMIVGRAGSASDYVPPPVPPTPPSPPSPTATAAPPPPSAGEPYTAPPPSSSPVQPMAATELDPKTKRKIDDFFSHRHDGRITGSAFAIAWSVILIIFFNFFWQYIAFYTGNSTGGVVGWTRETFFTNDIKLWLPILTTTLVVSIICHMVKILIDRNLLDQALHIIMDGFGLATMITLLVIFPFDFSVIPNNAAATGTSIGVTVVLIIIAVGLGISRLVRFIKLLVSICKAIVRAN